MLGPLGALAGAAIGGIGGALIPMAEGGIVTGPTPALVGEAGAEAIMPLDMFTNKLDELINAVKSPTGGSDIVVKVMLNERELGEAVVPMVDKRVLGR
jgi:outer membrane lipoprotein SlyB